MSLTKKNQNYTQLLEDGGRYGTLAEKLQDALEEMIFDGSLKPGDRLDEVELGGKFGVSRTPVREALRSLNAKGLVEIRGRHGVTVSVLSASMLIEMFEVTSVLEGLCAKHVARRATVEQKQKLWETHKRLIDSIQLQDPSIFYEINNEFHDLIYEASRAHFLAKWTQELRRRIAPYRRKVTEQPGRMNATILEHEAILNAIEASDPAGAQAAASQHVMLLGDDLVDFIASL